MIAALDLIVGISLFRPVTLMHRLGDGQSLFDQRVPGFPFVDHVGCDLVLEAVHAFVEIATRAGIHRWVLLRAQAISRDGLGGAPLRPGTHQQAGFPGHRVPAERLFDLDVIQRILAGVGSKIVLPQAVERRNRFVLVHRQLEFVLAGVRQWWRASCRVGRGILAAKV